MTLRSLACCLAALASACLAADPPVGWRGDGTGQHPTAQPPLKWSATENVLWKTEVGAGSSSPIIVGGKVLLTAEPDALVCLDAATGKDLWRAHHKIADFPAAANAAAPIRPNQYGDATPTPVSDGKRVWAFYNTGIVACHELDGRLCWSKWFDFPFTAQYGRAASPLLIGDRLIVHFGPLVCLNAATGEVVWTCNAAKAVYGTPISVRIGDVDTIITPSGDIVRTADGKVLASDIGHCMYASPVIQGRIVYFLDSSMSAVQLPEKAADKIDAKELWYEDMGGEFYASPIVTAGRVYAVDRSANLFILDAATGKNFLNKALDLPPAGRSESPNVYPSLCLTSQHLLVSNDAGQAVLLTPDNQANPAGGGSLPAGSGATPAFTAERMFIRGGKLLYCIAR